MATEERGGRIICDFDGTTFDNGLTCCEGDIVTIIGIYDSWAYVELNGARGYVPKSYIASDDEITEDPENTSDEAEVIEEESEKEKEEEEDMGIELKRDSNISSRIRERVKLFNEKNKREHEVPASHGTHLGRNSLLEERKSLSNKEAKKPVSRPNPITVDEDEQDFPSFPSSPVNNSSCPSIGRTTFFMVNKLFDDVDTDKMYEEAGLKGLEGLEGLETVSERVKCITLYEFKARNAEELSIAPGECVWIIEDGGDDWVDVVNAKGKNGFVPITYIEELMEEFEVEALYDFIKTEENGLQLRVGDRITVREESNDWYEGVNARGEEGWFPKSYVATVYCVGLEQT